MSKTVSKSSANSRTSSWWQPLLAFTALAALGITAASYVFQQGWTLWYGDAQAHLTVARRMIDSRTPGWEQVGTVWLPLTHVLMLPFVGDEDGWERGLAGVYPAVTAFILAGTFLFLALRRLSGSNLCAAAGLAVFALNPNLLYLQSIPMTESLVLAGVCGTFYFLTRFADKPSLVSVVWAAVFATVGTMTRYEAWFLLPFIALFFLAKGGAMRWKAALLFTFLAALAPLYWFAHNWWYNGDALEFYRGYYSAKMIYQRALDQGMARYPGDHDWGKAWVQYREAVRLCLGLPLSWFGVIGLLAALAVLRRAWWAVIFVLLIPGFYVLSIYSSGTPIHVPHLWPHSWYNTRYGLNALPLAALGVATLCAAVPTRLRAIMATVVVAGAITPWLLDRTPEAWITWKESQVNSVGRRAWTRAAALYLGDNYNLGDGIFSTLGDLAGIYREAGIPLRETLNEGNGPLFLATVARPDLFLSQKWAVAISGDKVATAILRAQRNGPRYERVRMFAEKNSPVIEVYRRIHEHPIHQGARTAQ